VKVQNRVGGGLEKTEQNTWMYFAGRIALDGQLSPVIFFLATDERNFVKTVTVPSSPEADNTHNIGNQPPNNKTSTSLPSQGKT
jgi:hypothetical protein